jgi:hypothetical protein
MEYKWIDTKFNNIIESQKYNNENKKQHKAFLKFKCAHGQESEELGRRIKRYWSYEYDRFEGQKCTILTIKH